MIRVKGLDLKNDIEDLISTDVNHVYHARIKHINVLMLEPHI